MKIGYISLGCCKNLVDSQNTLSFLKASGHSFVKQPKNADVIIINTCGFIDDAKQESIDTILEMAEYKNKSLKYLIVMGCLVTRYKEELKKELPEVDLFISIDQYKDLEKILNDFLKSNTIYKKETVLLSGASSAYLRIADGCDNKCSYCAIPLIRKDYHSLPFDEIVLQAQELERIGVKELNIIAQDTTRYGIDLYHKLRLSDLLVELNKMSFKWIRILYMYPDEITEELLDTMAKLDKVVPYFDIPIQHANNRLLALMNRRGTKQHIISIVNSIRSKFAHPTIRTTAIVGFPSETDQEFEELCHFISDIRFDKLGAFTYSQEEDTTSYDMEGQLEQDIKDARLDKLMTLQAEIEKSLNEKYIGKEIDVLIEKQISPSGKYYRARAAFQAPDDIDGFVKVSSDFELEIGGFTKVRITHAGQHDLVGVAVK